MGSNCEAPHLSRAERKTVTREVRSALDEAGVTSVPIISGASDALVRGTLIYVATLRWLALTPSSSCHRAIFRFAGRGVFLPAVTAGISMDSDLILEISSHPNIVGTKFTCGDTGKLALVASAKSTKTPKSNDGDYLVLGGLADFGLQALVAGVSGFVGGGANVLPKTWKHLYDLFNRGNFEMAMKTQAELSEADWPHTNNGLAGTKRVLQKHLGYGGLSRRPLGALSPEVAQSLDAQVQHFMVREAKL
ncbi:hypothetical protein LTR67_011219 [Exophiala xenobiotica]